MLMSTMYHSYTLDRKVVVHTIIFNVVRSLEPLVYVKLHH